jgi:ketosteroid isomerase-like protein
VSEENVEIVRRAYIALSQGDEDTLREMAAPEFVVDFSRRLVEPAVLRGRDEALAALGQIREPWDDWPVWEPQELIEASDKVLAFIRTTARGKGSGVEVEAHVWNLWTIREEKMVELTYFGDDRAAGLEAARRSE